MDPENNRRYNFIYKKLVQSDDDIVGLIAYGIYKHHKILLINNFKKENNREPHTEECMMFHATSSTEDQLYRYRGQAEDLITEIIFNTAAAEIEEAIETEKQNYRNSISESVKKSLPSNWSTFFVGLGASILGAIIISALSMFFYIQAATIDKENRDAATEKVNELTGNENSIDTLSSKLKTTP